MSTEEGQRGFASFRDVALALGIEKGEEAAGFSHCCSSRPAGPVLPTEFPFQSVSVEGSDQSIAVGFIAGKLVFFPSSVDATWREPEASALSEKVTFLPRLFSETARRFCRVPTWLFLSLYPQARS